MVVGVDGRFLGSVEDGERLAEAGVEVEVIRCDGLIHGFFGQSRTVQAAVEPMVQACAALKAALS